MEVRAYAGSDVGRVRRGNEDSAFAGSTTFAVADGMGGHVAGEVASETALEPVRELDIIEFRNDKAARQALLDAITTANSAVVEKADADPSFRGMGTTLTVALLRAGKLHVAHVGDSRAYLLRGTGELTQLTTDHTLVEQLIQEGRLSREDAANHPQRSVITRAIGIETNVEIDALPPLGLQPGDQVLLCSDGLTGPVSDAQITELLTSIPDGDAACEALIDAANAAGGPDNITVVLLRVQGNGEQVQTASPVPAETADDDATTEEIGTPQGAPAGASPGSPPDASAGASADAPPSVPPGAPAAADGEVTQIRTRQESGRDWATSMRDYGAHQGTAQSTGSAGRRRGPRILTGLLGLLVIGGLLAGGVSVLLSRAWYVGEQDGRVAVFRGLPSEVAGLRLARVEDTTDIALDELTVLRAERIRQGVTFGSDSEARDFVETLREEVAEAEAEAEAEENAKELAPNTGASPESVEPPR